MKPNRTTLSLSQALARAAHQQQAGQLQEAEQLYRQIAQTHPKNIEVWGNLGNLLQQQGRLEEAKGCYQRLLQIRPHQEVALNNLGNVFQKQDRMEEAIIFYQRALAANPNYALAHNNLGVMWQKQGKLEEALKCFQRALTANPHYAAAYSNLGCLYQEQSQFEEAKLSFRRALQIHPQFVEAYHNLAKLFTIQGQFEEALQCLQQALALDPQYVEAYESLAKVFAAQRRYEEVEICYRHLITLKPEWAAIYNGLGTVLALQGKFEEAKQSLQHALQLNPNQPGITAKLALMLPALQSSLPEILASRRQLENNLTELLKSDIKLKDPFLEVGEINFFSTYQGLNEREMQMKLASFYESACPSLLYTAPHCGEDYTPPVAGQTIKLGVVLKHHQMNRIISGVIVHLSRHKFHLNIFFIPPKPEDKILSTLLQPGDNFEVLPFHLETARQQIAAQQLDILFYPNIGDDDGFTYFLAFARLAPVQCTTWGFPRTTGLRNLDYFISARDIESEAGEAQAHYSEQLILLNRLPIFFAKPRGGTWSKTRQEFGLSDQHHIYFCPQSSFKFHPEFDTILADILSRDPVGQLVLIEGGCQYWSELLKQRFKQTIPQVMKQIVFLPKQEFDVFLNLIALADVMLDTFPFGGGLTTHDALAVGTPIVTLPTQFMCGRATYYCYKRMGVLDCVATNPQHYVEIALRLGTDVAYRDQLKAKILATNQVLYEDIEAVRELEGFLVEAIAKVK